MVVVENVESVGTPGFAPLLEAFLNAPLGEEDRQTLDRAIEGGTIRFVLARQDDVPAGICSLSVAFTTYRCAPFATIDDLFVAPSSRGQGVARLLLERAMSEAAARGCRSVVLGCSQEQQAMYEHLGFKPIGHMMARDPTTPAA